jgi:hypothetical protein
MHYGLLHALVECALNPGFRKLKIKLILEEGGGLYIMINTDVHQFEVKFVEY